MENTLDLARWLEEPPQRQSSKEGFEGKRTSQKAAEASFSESARARWAKQAWGALRERVTTGKAQALMDVDEWIASPKASASSLPSGMTNSLGASLPGGGSPRKIVEHGHRLTVQAADTAVQLMGKGSERCRDLARVGVADVAAKLLPRVEALKEKSVDTWAENEGPDDGWGQHVKGYVKSVIHEKSKEAIYVACRQVGLDPEKLQEEAESCSAAAAAAVPSDKYVTNNTVREALAAGDTVLIKGSWLLKRCSAGGILPPRQELEARYPNAIWKVDELMELAEAGAVAMIAVSHGWCTSEHPDPCGEQVQILCDTLRQFLSSTPLEDVAFFIDWCSLHQRPRSDDEEAAFARAQRAVHLWYVHQGIRVWMLTKMPTGAERNLPYSERGWPTLERLVSEMVTKSNFLLDLGQRDSSCTSWGRTAAACRPLRRPPLTPEAFAEELSGKAFTEPTDRDLVMQMYTRSFFEVIMAAEELAFNELAWGDREALALAAALLQCMRLRKVTLYGNHIGEEGGLALVQASSRIASLEELWLNNNPVGRVKDSKAKLLNEWLQIGRSHESLHL